MIIPTPSPLVEVDKGNCASVKVYPSTIMTISIICVPSNECQWGSEQPAASSQQPAAMQRNATNHVAGGLLRQPLRGSSVYWARSHLDLPLTHVRLYHIPDADDFTITTLYSCLGLGLYHPCPCSPGVISLIQLCVHRLFLPVSFAVGLFPCFESILLQKAGPLLLSKDGKYYLQYNGSGLLIQHYKFPEQCQILKSLSPDWKYVSAPPGNHRRASPAPSRARNFRMLVLSPGDRRS